MTTTNNARSTVPHCVDRHDSPPDAAFDSVTASVAPNPVGMVTLSDDLLVLEANATFCDLVGYSETALLLTSIADLAHPDDRDTCLLLFTPSASGGLRTRQAESRCLRADGHVIWVAITLCSTVDGAEHRAARFVAQFEDITARKTAAVRASR